MNNTPLGSLRRPAELERLDEFREFVTEAAMRANLPDMKMPGVELVLEEIYVNVASYAYDGAQGDVEILCSTDARGRFQVTVKDWGQAFNPLDAAEPDLDAGIDERAIGGLGVHLTKQITDEVLYERQDGANVLTLFFTLTAPTQ